MTIMSYFSTHVKDVYTPILYSCVITMVHRTTYFLENKKLLTVEFTANSKETQDTLDYKNQ